MLISREIAEKVFDHPDALALAVYADPLRFDAEWRFQWRPPFLRRYRRVRTEPPRYEVEKPVGPEDYRLSKLLVGKFAIPENSDRSDEEMLKEVVDFAAREEMVSWRRSFHEWVADMAPRGLTDATIVREMSELVADYNAAVKRKKWATITKTSATLIGGGMGIGAACWAPLAVPAKAPVSAVGNVIADRIAGDQPEGGIAAAALLAEAAKRLR